MNLKNLLSVIILFGIISIKDVEAYPHFVGYGYTSCLTCHYNPYGSGPLNDYGRALSATAISARMFHADFVTEEEIAEKSGFLYGQPKNTWFRPSFDYRGLLLRRDFGEETQTIEWIDMMADANIVLKFLDNKLYMSTTVGYAPIPDRLKDSEEKIDEYLIREAYIGYRPNENWGVYLGHMDKIFGIRIAEHSSYSRSVTDLSHNDQTYGMQVHFMKGNFEIGTGVFVGNQAQEDELRQKGASVKVDYVMPHKGTIGFSSLKSESEFLETYMQAFHLKTSAGRGASFLAEVGSVKKSAKQISDYTPDVSNYALAQIYLNPKRGVYFVNSVEYLKTEKKDDYSIRFGPGLQIFPSQRVEIKADLYNTRNFSKTSSSRDTWDLLTQVHLWF